MIHILIIITLLFYVNFLHCFYSTHHFHDPVIREIFYQNLPILEIYERNIDIIRRKPVKRGV